MRLTIKDGKLLVKLARESISKFFENEEIDTGTLKERYAQKQGVFVTLYIEDELRGCIGFPEPVYPLFQAVIYAARGSAFSDPRFPQLTKDEFISTRIELSILTLPELINIKKPEEYIKAIKIGRDGLIIRGSFNSGLLLPIVAVEYGWSLETFLRQLCLKAGLPSDAWKDINNKVYKFQSQVFSETKPNGEVIEKM